MKNMIKSRDHLFTMYAKSSKNLTFLTPTCAYQGVRNVSY